MWISHYTNDICGAIIKQVQTNGRPFGRPNENNMKIIIPTSKLQSVLKGESIPMRESFVVCSTSKNGRLYITGLMEYFRTNGGKTKRYRPTPVPERVK